MDNEVLVYYIPRAAAVPATSATESDIADIQSRLSTLEAGHPLTDHPDVDATGLADGNVLIWDADDGEWKAGAPPNNAIVVWDDASGFDVGDAYEAIYASQGLERDELGSVAIIKPTYAGTGSANTIARSDHSHSAVVGDILTGAASGVLSSGTRTLSGATTGALASGVTYDLDALALVRCRNNVNSGVCNLLFRIGADGSYPERSRAVQTVGGVPVDQLIHFRGVFVGAGSGLAISWRIQFVSGDATDVRDWELWYSFRPRR